MPTDSTNPENPEEQPEALTEETLQKRLREYQEAYRQEFEVSLKAKPDQAAELTQEFFKENMPLAGASIVWLAEHAESEGIRLAASKFIIERGTKDSEAQGDPLQRVLDQLTKPKGKVKN